MASGLTLVASSIASAREIVDDGRNGFLFPLGDDRALAERVIELVRDPERRAAIGRNARASVADRGIERAVAAYVRELETFVAARRGQGLGR
jgi:glycosyltransferase involved in cell wall biosynthesis